MVSTLFDGWRDGRLTDAYRTVRLEITSDRELRALDQITMLFQRDLPDHPAKAAIERDQRRRAAELIVSDDLKWGDAIHKIRNSDEDKRKSRTGKSWGKGRKDPDRGGIGD